MRSERLESLTGTEGGLEGAVTGAGGLKSSGADADAEAETAASLVGTNFVRVGASALVAKDAEGFEAAWRNRELPATED